MRLIGYAERALELMINRVSLQNRTFLGVAGLVRIHLPESELFSRHIYFTIVIMILSAIVTVCALRFIQPIAKFSNRSK